MATSTGVKFDGAYNLIEPTFILCKRSGEWIGRIPVNDIHHEFNLNAPNECSFTVYKDRCEEAVWRNLIDLKLVYIKEYNEFYQLTVDLTDKNKVYKSCSLVGLAEAELSQILLNGYEINTDDDIARDDYEVSVFFNNNYPKASIMHRLFEKAPHYTLAYCDESLRQIQRSFSFNGTSLYDAMQDMAEEFKCLFVFDNSATIDGQPARAIRIYDLCKTCNECGHRGEWTGTCPNCGASEDQYNYGYGEDTTVFINTDNLADNIKVTVDTDELKNCFYLDTGDDLMNAAVMACNPNGSLYLWNISSYFLNDMSDELVDRLLSYDELYNYYQTEYKATIPSSILSNYNTLVNKYKYKNLDVDVLESPIVGFPALMQAYYQTIDFALYLQHEMSPIESKGSTTAEDQAKLIKNNCKAVSVLSLTNLSEQSASNAVLQYARICTSSGYQVSVVSSSYSNGRWVGSFKVTSYTDDEDTAVTGTMTVSIDDDYEEYLEQKIKISLTNKNYEIGDVVSLYSKTNTQFAAALKNYGATELETIYQCAQVCLDVLITAGIGDSSNENYSLYKGYYDKQVLVAQELAVRNDEIAIITGLKDSKGYTTQEGIQDVIEEIVEEIQEALDFQAYLGQDLWLEFCRFRREDTYSNDNFISDGLDTADLFLKAMDFVDLAKTDLQTASTPQKTITAPMKNLLMMKEFQPLVEHFKVGNWIHCEIDDEIYRLRLISYETDYDETLNVTFSDAVLTPYGYTDVASILDQAASMSTSFDVVKRQAKRGDDANNIYSEWVNKGLNLTNTRIVSNPDDQEMTLDEHGLLSRVYNPLSETYDGKQVKLFNKGLYFTDDSWESLKAAIGDFIYWNPETQVNEEAYGVIADTIIGNIILSEKTGIYTEDGYVTIDRYGLEILSDQALNPDSNMHFSLSKKYLNKDDEEETKQVMYVDANGDFVFDGTSVLFQISEGEESTTLANYVNTSLSVLNGNINLLVEESIKEVTQSMTAYTDDVTANMSSDLAAMVNNAVADMDASVANKLVNYYTKSEIDIQRDAINLSVSENLTISQAYSDNLATATLLSANNYTATQLLDYYTKSEIDIQKNEISLSVSENLQLSYDYADSAASTATTNANNYTDTKLTNYYTKAQIDIKTDEINLSVTQSFSSANEYSDSVAAAAVTNANSYADSVASSAITSANNYTDAQLVGYYTKAQIDIKNDEIISSVDGCYSYADGLYQQASSYIDQKASSITLSVSTLSNQVSTNTTNINNNTNTISQLSITTEGLASSVMTEEKVKSIIQQSPTQVNTAFFNKEDNAVMSLSSSGLTIHLSSTSSSTSVAIQNDRAIKIQGSNTNCVGELTPTQISLTSSPSYYAYYMYNGIQITYGSADYYLLDINNSKFSYKGYLSVTSSEMDLQVPLDMNSKKITMAYLAGCSDANGKRGGTVTSMGSKKTNSSVSMSLTSSTTNTSVSSSNCYLLLNWNEKSVVCTDGTTHLAVVDPVYAPVYISHGLICAR